ncbi:MAG TPA: DUF3232 domain-containing protein [Gelria sp.]|nr:DUF3232 domain-containing protein [Gelria sp.]
MSIKQRINALLRAIDAEDAEESLKNRKKSIVQNLLESAVKYIDIVIKQGITIQINEGNSDRETIEELVGIDQSRSRIHDSLIGQIAVVNRMCSQYGLDPIYQGKDTRIDKGDFALELIIAYFQDRIT